MYGDQFGEFVRGYWGLKGHSNETLIAVNLLSNVNFLGFYKRNKFSSAAIRSESAPKFTLTN